VQQGKNAIGDFDYAIYTATGVFIRSGRGSQIDIRGLSPGSYVLMIDRQPIPFIRN
jgi:outer membrane receptor for ferrienterochelin and colicin